jgi:hypothetical protein
LPDRSRIRFELPDPKLGEAEFLWGVKTGDGVYRIDNIPLLVFGLSMGDEVRVRLSDEGLEFDRVTDRGGHSTYRIMIGPSNTVEDSGQFRQLVELGCGYEAWSPRFVAIDVLPEVDVNTVYEALERGMDRGEWTFEEGHCGHRVEQ